MRAGVGFGFVLALWTGCTSTQFKPCTNDSTVCGPDAWCNPATQLCERPPGDLAVAPPDLAPSDLAFCKAGFVTGTAITLGQTQAPTNLAIANLDGNKFGDVLFLEPSIDKLTVMLQTDYNVYAAQHQYAVGNSPHSLAVADFDGGNVDVAVIGTVAGPASIFQVLTGAGAGALNPAQSIIPNQSGLFGELHAGTFLGGTHPDLVALSGTGSNNSLATLKNSSSANTLSFTKTGQAYSPTNELHLASGDVDGDGYTDVLTARGSGSNYYVTVNYGNPAGLNTRSVDTGGATATLLDIAAGDINGDHRDDIVTIDSLGTITVWYGASGQAPSQNGKAPISVGSALSQLVMADFNGDGYADVATIGKMTPYAYVYFGSAAGLDPSGASVQIGSLTNNDIAVGDPNGDSGSSGIRGEDTSCWSPDQGRRSRSATFRAVS
jgi:hypothetical protein